MREKKIKILGVLPFFSRKFRKILNCLIFFVQVRYLYREMFELVNKELFVF
jgi:hypothetical protein